MRPLIRFSAAAISRVRLPRISVRSRRIHVIEYGEPFSSGKPFPSKAAELMGVGRARRSRIANQVGINTDVPRLRVGANQHASVDALSQFKPPRGWMFQAQLEFVVSANLHRRHLTTSQRTMIANELAQRPHGDQRARGDRQKDLSQTDAAKLPAHKPSEKSMRVSTFSGGKSVCR